MNLLARPTLRTLLVYAFACLAAALPARAQEQTFRTYGTTDGLNNLNIRCLLQDRTGFLWVGTDNGLFRFDGNHFVQFSHVEGLPNTEIHALAESPSDGSLWVATPDGLARMDGRSFHAVPAQMLGDAGTINAIAFTPNGEMYVENAYGILKRTPDYIGGWLYEPVAAGDVHGLLVHADTVIFGWNKDVWRVHGHRAEPFGTPHGLPHDLWSALASDHNGNLWVRSNTQLWEFPQDGSTFINRSTGVTETDDTEIAVDRHGHVYVNTIAGAVELDNQKETPLDSRHGLDGDGVGPMLVDRDDSLWLGLAGGGLVRRLGHGEWTSWKRADGLPHNAVWSIVRDRAHQTWVGTSGGLALLDAAGTVRRTWNIHHGLPADRVLSLEAVPDGDIFAGSDPAGITQFSVSGQRLHVYGAADGLSQRITGMAVDHEGRLWAVGNGGAFRSTAPARAGAHLRFEPIPIPGLAPGVLFRDVIVTPADQIWMATSRGALWFDGVRWHIFTEASGLKSADLDTLIEHNGEIWIAYRDAIGMRCARVQGDRLVGHDITTHDGLSSDNLYAFAFDSAGRLWASSDKGMNVLDHDVWKHYGSEEGLIWDDTNSRSLFIDSDDGVWIGTSGGLSRHVPLPYALPSPPPSIVVTNVHSGRDKNWLPGDRPVIPFADRTLSFHFTALTYTGSHHHFRYRVLGYQDRWIDSTSHNVQLAALPAGQYVFEVISEVDRRWSPVPASFAFTILAPWWLRWPFVLAMTLLAAVAARMLWQLRLRKLIAQKELLQRKVEEQTAELVESHRQLESIAYFDLLTSLPNRRMFGNEFRKRLNNARRHDEIFALLLIDLDLFKQVNDTYGHDAGDAVLIETAARLQSAVRNCDCVARLGGDEFAILLAGSREKLSGERGIEAVEIVCRRILENCSRPITFMKQTLQVGCSIGIAMFPGDASSEDLLYKAADIALYHTKRTSRNGFTWYSATKPLNAPATPAPKPHPAPPPVPPPAKPTHPLPPRPA